MDTTKSPLAVVTMVYQDYVFLKRWYDYYSKQVGAENLYVYSHGNDPEHRAIAKDANVIHLPRDETMYKFDRRRWRALGHCATGLLEFYNWVIVADVDEITIVDPHVAATLPEYLHRTFPDMRKAPKNIAPFCLEIIHVPQEEPLPIVEGETILSRRRIFRPNWNYSKPCLVAGPVVFGPGGHRNTLGPRHLPADLYTLHLKYFDIHTLEGIAAAKKKMVMDAGRKGSKYDETHGWYRSLDTYHRIIASTELEGEDIELPDYRAKMQKQIERYKDQFIWGNAQCSSLYRIPARFSDVF